MSFGDANWMAHLLIPPDNHRPQPCSSVCSDDQVRGVGHKVWLIAPLWEEGDQAGARGRDRRLPQLACVEPELKKELNRLRAAAAECKVVLSAQWQRAVDAAVRQ